jgi:quinoprotein glucose dehydrogenase
VGNRQDRRYILESILYPNNKIADGFQTVIVTLKDTSIQVGTVKGETDTELTLTPPIPGAPPVTVKKAEIKTRENAPSGMPPGFDHALSRRELRDLVEYVANLKS